MIILTGPQTTNDECGFLEEMAGLFEAHLTTSGAVEWTAVTGMVCLTGWEKCPAATADVAIAEAFGLVVRIVTV